MSRALLTLHASRIHGSKIRKSRRGSGSEGFEEKTAKGRQKNCDARWAKTNNETHYEWKNHIKADAETKLITAQMTTDASVHDSQTFKQLVNEEG